jgi:hypothetical protein
VIWHINQHFSLYVTEICSKLFLQWYFDLRFLGINVFNMFQFLNFLSFLQFRIQICLDSWVSIMTSSALDDRGIVLKFWQLKEILHLHHDIRTGSGTHPPTYLMCTGMFSQGLKQPQLKLNTHISLVLALRMLGAIPKCFHLFSLYDA